VTTLNKNLPTSLDPVYFEGLYDPVADAMGTKEGVGIATTNGTKHMAQRVVMLDGDNATLKASTPSTTQVSASATSVTLLTASAARKGAIIFNNSAIANLYFIFGATASTSAFTYKLGPMQGYELPLPIYTGAISGIWDSANGNAQITEVS
jgi:hypothetical protein